MYFWQKTANQQAGMGLKLTKFHAIVHMATDILHFGMPMCFDTGSDEAVHKSIKKTAKVEEEGVLPAKIWGFVDFRMAKPHNEVVNFGGIDIEPSIYAMCSVMQEGIC
jgi:hypothetical protein